MVVPVLSTVAITAIQALTATSGGGTITSIPAVTAKGVCRNTTGTPTIADPKTSNGTGTTAFVSLLTGLLEVTGYHVRAYATNSDGTGYGNELDFTTESDPIIKSILTGRKDLTLTPIIPSIRSIATSRPSFYGVPHINNFYYNPTQIILPYYPNYGVGDGVQFYSAVDGTPTDRSRDFGDGGVSVDQHPIYIYALPGTYTVTLTVSNSYGTDTMTKVGYIVIVPSYPSIKSINTMFGRPTYQIQNFPTILSINTSWNRPVYSPVGQQGSNPVFMFAGF